MNYFTLFEIPVSLKVDSTSLLKKYYFLSKKYHPDNYTLENEMVQEHAEEMTALINEAKKILDNPNKRLAYILKENEVIVDDEKYTLPPAFLGEMMDVNEQLMELEFAPDTTAKEKIKQEIKNIEASLYNDVKIFFEKEILTSDDIKSGPLKLYYYKRKYLDRILDRL